MSDQPAAAESIMHSTPRTAATAPPAADGYRRDPPTIPHCAPRTVLITGAVEPSNLTQDSPVFSSALPAHAFLSINQTPSMPNYLIGKGEDPL